MLFFVNNCKFKKNYNLILKNINNISRMCIWLFVMKEGLESQNLETVTEEVNNGANTLGDIFKKCVAALEVVEKALGIEHASHNDKATKLLSKELSTSEHEQNFVSREAENIPKGEYINTKKYTQQKQDLVDLRLTALNAGNLKKWSQELTAKSQQLRAKSTELRIYSEDLVARSHSNYSTSKYYQRPDGAP